MLCSSHPVFHWQNNSIDSYQICSYLMIKFYFLSAKVGDFGILVRSGFTVSKALFFNFLSALVALAGTALVSFCSFLLTPKGKLLFWIEYLILPHVQALSLGKDPGHSSLIEVCCFLLNGMPQFLHNINQFTSIHISTLSLDRNIFFVYP